MNETITAWACLLPESCSVGPGDRLDVHPARHGQIFFFDASGDNITDPDPNGFIPTAQVSAGSDATPQQREMGQAARLTISQELGHERAQIIAAYCS
jgi:hypothetical protein